MIISIVTVVYNGEEFIEETIKSIINQDYPNIEYIVVDGNSNDGTFEILQKYEKNIDILIREDDEGQTDALIKGIVASTGRYVCWLNYDDLFHDNNSISKLVNFISKNPNHDLYYGDDILIDSDGRALKKRSFKNMNFDTLLKIKSISQPASIFSKRIFEKYGLDKNLIYSMDLDFS